MHPLVTAEGSPLVKAPLAEKLPKAPNKCYILQAVESHFLVNWIEDI